MSVRQPFYLLLLSLLVFLSCDNLIFRSGIYDLVASPDPLPGQVFNTVYFENKRVASQKPEILITGNSRIHWGFWVKQFEDEHPDADLHLIQVGIAGTYEKMWYFLLQILDPHHDRYAAIVIPLANYKVDSWHIDRENSYDNAQMLASVLHISQWPEMIQSFADDQIRRRALMLGLFASHGYALDLQDLIWEPQQRVKAVHEHRKAGALWLYDWAGSEGSMSEIKLDDAGHVVTFPSRLNSFEKKETMDELTPHTTHDEAEQDTAMNAAYQSKWLNKIIGLYRDSPTKLIFLQLPRWPMPLPGRTPVENAPDLRDLLVKAPNVVFIDENAFTSLEAPPYFYDTLHLNRVGRHEFTHMLGEKIMEIMKKPVPPMG